MSPKLKEEIRRVFLDKLGDLKEYEQAENSWKLRQEYIRLRWQKYHEQFDYCQRKLEGQSDFTWKQLVGASSSFHVQRRRYVRHQSLCRRY